MNTTTSPPNAASPGAWSPLTQPTFRMMWLAVLIGNIGTWIHDVSAAWLMAESTGSPFMVAAVQSATTLPVVLLAVFAGTLADIVDRRKYLILAQLWMLLVAGTLALLAHLDMLGPWTVIALTFALANQYAAAGSTVPLREMHTYPFNGHEGGEAVHVRRQLRWLDAVIRAAGTAAG